MRTVWEKTNLKEGGYITHKNAMSFSHYVYDSSWVFTDKRRLANEANGLS